MSTLMIPTERRAGQVVNEMNKIRKSIDEMALIYRVLYGRSSLMERSQVTLHDATFYRYGRTFQEFLVNNSHQVDVYEAVGETK